MEAKAIAKYIHMAPQKVRLVATLIRGLSLSQAERQLMFSKKIAAKPMLKLLKSAMANAKNVDADTLSNWKIVSLMVNEGPTIKRHTPRAQGRSTPIRKRTSHIMITIGDTANTEKKEK